MTTTSDTQTTSAPTRASGPYIDEEWPDGRWDEGASWGPNWWVDLTPGALPDTVRQTDYDRIAVQPSMLEGGVARVSLLMACESGEHNTELTVDEAEAYGRAILEAVTAARARVGATT